MGEFVDTFRTFLGNSAEALYDCPSKLAWRHTCTLLESPFERPKILKADCKGDVCERLMLFCYHLNCYSDANPVHPFFKPDSDLSLKKFSEVLCLHTRDIRGIR